MSNDAAYSRFLPSEAETGTEGMIMVKNEFDKAVRSFVSFALAMTPELIVTEHHEGSDKGSRAVRLGFNDKRKMSDHEYSSLESLLSKLKRIQDFMLPSKTLDDLEVTDFFPTVAFQPNTQYQIISISAEQLEIAKDVARRAHQQSAQRLYWTSPSVGCRQQPSLSLFGWSCRNWT